jgi:integrase
VSIQKRGNTWRARYRGPDGKERNKSFRRKIDAERWLAQQRTLLASGDWTDPTLARITFGSYAESWLNARTDLKPKTRFQYSFLLDRHILPTWGHVTLAKITFEGVSQWVAGLSANGIGSSAIRQSVFVLSSVLDHAVKARRLRINPARGIALPATPHRDYVILSHDQVARFAACAGPGGLVITFLAYTGLRWGEMTALRVSDVDLSRKRVDIRRAFSDVGGRLVLGTPKSSRSHRTVPLPGFLVTELAEHLAGKEPSALVFTTDTGTPLRLSNWRKKVFAPAQQAAKLDPRLRLHDLRHTAASLMIQAGYPPKMVQEILGHASITTTLDLYGHLFPGDLDRYANLLDEAAGRARVAKQGPQDDEDPDGGATEVLTNMP